jgi:hypothetical protein
VRERLVAEVRADTTVVGQALCQSAQRTKDAKMKRKETASTGAGARVESSTWTLHAIGHWHQACDSREHDAREKLWEVISESDMQRDEAAIISSEGAMAGAETNHTRHTRTTYDPMISCGTVRNPRIAEGERKGCRSPLSLLRNRAQPFRKSTSMTVIDELQTT